ncbi:hypothetical protein DPMN_016417 [Dreissena polymorpha]|uniref:Uncharacterized protein n=1 Tax=Dreissena polymorpha TaxID=45954 RepID=A0A9D4NFL4_DREPO|nr:hypothetical protein DPMN_016417 [Dreissena polymorpha]
MPTYPTALDDSCRPNQTSTRPLDFVEKLRRIYKGIEIENQHFGRTPCNTPFASQQSCSSDSESDDHPVDQQQECHARSHVDSGFAAIKKRYRVTDVETLAEMAGVVEQSSVTNTAITYPLWPWNDWKSFLEPRVKTVR